GNFNGSEAGCARFSFGGERLIDDDGELDVPDMFGMYTVKVDVNNNFYFENSQQLKNDSWTTKAGGSSWTQIYYPIFDMIVSHKAGEDTLHLQFIDLNGDVIYTTTTRDYDPGYLDGVKYFSFFVWQSQAQFTKMEYLHEFTVLEDKPAAPPPGPSQLDYTPYTDFGTTEDTQDWDLGGVYKFKSSVNGDVLGADGVGMGDGARASYQGKLSGDWSIETAMRFENAADIYSGRVYFYGDDGGLRGIVSAKMNQSGEAWMEAQMLSGDWSDLIAAPSPAVVPTKDVWVSIGKKAGGVLVIRALDEQGTQIYYGETNAMTNIGEVTAFALVLDETCAVFDRVLVGTDAGGIVSMGAPTADFGGAKDSPVWTLGDDVFAKAGSREGEALLFNSDINTTATAGLGNAAFSLSMDILFSKTYNDGRFVSRFFLRDEDDGLLAIVDFEADSSRQFMINAQKFENNEWGAIAGSGDWQPMVGRNASLTISRAGGADKLRIKAVDLAGNTLYDMETAAFNGAAAIRKVEINGNQVIAVLDNVVIR
ncbi:MAG: hypothetical protein FWG93_08585, partial [Oscillospiraceae bacterium]|nr:hypothetical protein [Oscillospiraceae bacterium]